MTLPDARQIAPGEDEPPFEEPWQAEAFALTVHLHSTGAFTWVEWVDALSRQLRGSGPQTTAGGYYRAWVAALEHLAVAKGFEGRAAMDRRKAAWRRAYETTPHGQPVTL